MIKMNEKKEISIKNKKLLQTLQLKGENINDTILRLINAYIYPYNPTHGFPFTLYHLDYEKSLAYQFHKRGGSQAKQTFNTEKGYNRWLKQLKETPKHLRGEI